MLDGWSWSRKCYLINWLTPTVNYNMSLHVIFRKLQQTFTSKGDPRSLPLGLYSVWTLHSFFSFFLSGCLSLPLCWNSRAVKLPRKHQSYLHFSGYPHLPTTTPYPWSALRGFHPCCYTIMLLSFWVPFLMHKSLHPHGGREWEW